MKPWVRNAGAFIISMITLVGAGGVVYYLMVSAPEVERHPEISSPPVVEVVESVVGLVPRVVEAHGTVIPAREIEIVPEVSGRIVEINPSLELGGVIKEGELLIRIDPEEYELAVEDTKSALAEAEAALEVEVGRQSVAQREWELFGKDLPNAEDSESLALREP